MGDKQKENKYSLMDIFWNSAKTEICFSNEKESTHVCLSNKYVINMIQNTIMRALIETYKLAKNSDPVVIFDRVEINNFHPKKKDSFNIQILIKPNWGKNLYDIKIMYNSDEVVSEKSNSNNTCYTYENQNITQNDLMCMLHHLLPKASRHVFRRKYLEDNDDYAASVTHIPVFKFKKM